MGDEYKGVYISENNKNIENYITYVIYGRFFNKDEMDNGDDSVLLGSSYLKKFSPEQIDDIWENGIELYGIRFNVIGNYESYLDAVKYDSLEDLKLSGSPDTIITMPIYTLKNHKMKVKSLICQFYDNFDDNYISQIQNIINKYDIEDVSYPISEKDIKPNNAITFTTIVLFISIFNIFILMNYVFAEEFYKYRIYSVCGAGIHHILYCVIFNIFMIISSAFVLSYALLYFMNTYLIADYYYFGNNLPLNIILFIYIVFLVVFELFGFIKTYLYFGKKYNLRK